MGDVVVDWAIVELMGHRRRAGRVQEVERFGTKMLRIDIPTDTAGVYLTEFYGGTAIYALRPCDEPVALAAAASFGDLRPVMPTTFRIAERERDYGDDATYQGDRFGDHPVA